jgi:hypothetical protein
LIKRAATVLGLAVFSVLSMVGMAMAQTDPSTVVGAGAADVKDELLSIAATVLPYAAILIALTLGWRFARKFVRG